MDLTLEQRPPAFFPIEAGVKMSMAIYVMYRRLASEQVSVTESSSSHPGDLFEDYTVSGYRRVTAITAAVSLSLCCVTARTCVE